ncbi:hypothetical protein Back2_04740 [Nocardioides baekrokdamisoli]|uniref:Phosphodiesterase n=1 Tax=Nocardioides baekrokdamisoli TaxID=1804624 RepID=A0A3G9IBG9_9ACTN|nr:DUF5998 family protein [Nocardioides baekrokdamisoli]BBH16187.1 hypothetical protein Back2_04740 [Nocardioides baekrokdamisoli]
MSSIDSGSRESQLRAAIDRTGYYPDVVTDAVAEAVAGEEIESFFVHHEPTFEHDEVRRHLTVLVLTPSRLVLVHTDEHGGDDLLPEPYTSTSTESIRLGAVTSVAVTRLTTSTVPARLAEANLAISWGSMSRLDLEPARCGDPDCDADHGYTGTVGGDDFTLRVSAAADGVPAVEELIGFAASVSARTRDT